MPRKKYGGGGGMGHMDSGLSYSGAPQGYRSDAGKPKKGHYGNPPAGYINQSGMPNGSAMARMMDYMSNYYSNTGVTNSTNMNTSPSPSSMDSSYKPGPVSRPSLKGRKKYA